MLTAGAILAGCASNIQFTDLQITGAATAGTRVALMAIPEAKREPVRNWMFYIATRVRTLSGDATPQQLNDLLVGSIPQKDLDQIPELKSVIIPAVVSVYQVFYAKFSSNHTRLLQILNDIATGIEAAASQK